MAGSPTSRRKPRRAEELVQSLDALERHMTTLETLAGLVRLCLEVPERTPINARTLGGAGALITQELRSLRTHTHQLRERLGA